MCSTLWACPVPPAEQGDQTRFRGPCCTQEHSHTFGAQFCAQLQEAQQPRKVKGRRRHLVAWIFSGKTTSHPRKGGNKGKTEATIEHVSPRGLDTGRVPRGSSLPFPGGIPRGPGRISQWTRYYPTPAKATRPRSRSFEEETSSRFLSLRRPTVPRPQPRGAGWVRLESPRRSLDAAEKCLRDLRAQAAG